MTISSETRIAGPYTGNGVTDDFPFAFKVFSSADLQVVRTDLVDIESILTLTTDYTVSLNADQDANPGGTVTLLTAPEAGYLITITSDVAYLQPVALTNTGGFYPRVLNDEFDRLTIQIQQLAERLGRTLTLPISSEASAALPTPSASAALVWSSDGLSLTNQQIGSGMLLREIINVNDSPYDGDIQAAVTANPGKLIWLPPGAWTLTSPVIVSSDYTRLMGAGAGITWVRQSGDNVDAFQFQPTNTTNGTFLNFCGITGVYVYNTTVDRTAGAGVRLTQCNGFIMEDMVISNFPEGLTVAGGQLNILDRFKVFGSILAGTPVANSAAIKFTNQQSGAGYQQAFTTQISNYIIGDSKHFADGILIEGADGLNFTNGYVSRTANYLLKLKPNISGKNISSVMFSTTYFDGNNQTTGTTNGIGILDDGFAGASLINDLVIDSTVKVGNLTGKGIYSTHPYILSLTADPTTFYNCAGTEVDVSSGMTTGIVGLWCPWTPTLNCTTPGDLSVTYSTRTGSYLRSKDGMVTAKFNIQTSAFTWTTASGNWTITGLPVASSAGEFGGVGGLSVVNGVTKVGYTQITPLTGPGASVITFRAWGSGLGSSTLAAADMPSGNSMILIGSTSYAAGEVY